MSTTVTGHMEVETDHLDRQLCRGPWTSRLSYTQIICARGWSSTPCIPLFLIPCQARRSPARLTLITSIATALLTYQCRHPFKFPLPTRTSAVWPLSTANTPGEKPFQRG
ncbi:hypothetical protein FIBSPDRAFT_6016 [Athelia psychrophila]|uniref:Uncharacterized protein n=1 Tax=Athelia psychrophila TaxID=1759441 RepID=A0A166X1Z4_9AGAM|nr:hypothetical protein FIBSPDRAFT_6016 [Fibularhizoctonia sp. CBS 109695]